MNCILKHKSTLVRIKVCTIRVTIFLSLRNKMDSEVTEMIGKKLRELRSRHHLSQTEFARRISVHPKSIKNWESDLSDPSLANLHTICVTFHVSADEFLGIESTEKVSLVSLSTDDRRKLIAMIQAFISSCET